MMVNCNKRPAIKYHLPNRERLETVTVTETGTGPVMVPVISGPNDLVSDQMISGLDH